MVKLYKSNKRINVIYCPVLLCFILTFLSINVFAQNNPVTGDFKSKASGNWNDYTIWQVFDGVSFINATEGQTPSEANSVFIEAGMTVTLTQNESVKNLHLNNAEDVVRLQTQDNILDVWGRMRLYTGSAPGSAPAGDLNLTILTINTGDNGKIRFKGSVERHIFGDFNGNRRISGWTIDFAFDEGVIGRIDKTIRCGNLTVSSGILLLESGVRLLVSESQNLNTIDGSVAIKSGATLRGGSGIYRTNFDPIENFTMEPGAHLLLNASGFTLAASIFDIRGTINFIGNLNQNFPHPEADARPRPGSSLFDTLGNLKITGTGNKKLLNNITILDTLIYTNASSLDLNNFALSYGPNGSLEYEGQTIQNTSSIEFPQIDGPKNLIINNPNHVNLHESRSIEGELNLKSGQLVLGNSDFTLGENSPAVSGNISSTNMVNTSGNGTLKKIFSTTGSYLFPVGESEGTAEYSPAFITVNKGNLNPSSFIGINVKGTKHPDDTSPFDFLSRYWSLQTNIDDIEYNATFNYLNDDITGDETSLNSYLYNQPSKTPLNLINFDLNLLEVFRITSGGDFSGSNICGISNNFITAPQIVEFCGSGDPDPISGTIPNTGGSRIYSWEKRINNGAWQIVPDAITHTLNEGLLDTSGKHEYRRLIHTDACEAAIPHYSNSISFIIEPPIQGNSINAPNVVDFCNSSPGFTIVGSIPTGGDDNFTYKWERRFDGTSWMEIGGNSKNFIEDELTQVGTYEYRRTASSSTCNDVSNIIIINIDPFVSNNIISLSEGNVFCESNNGFTIEGTIPTGGNGNYNYKWQRKTEGASWVEIEENSLGLQQSSLAKGNFEFRRVVSSANCNSTSNTLLIKIGPSDLNVSEEIVNTNSSINNGSINLNVTGGTLPYDFKWSNTSSTSKIENLSAGNYTVTVTDASGCQIQKTFAVSAITGIENPELESFLFYPNPTSEFLNVKQGNLGNAKVKLVLINNLGKVLFFKEFGSVDIIDERIDMTSLQDGIYFINFQSEGKSFIKKVIKFTR